MKDGEWTGKRTAYFEYGEVENQTFKIGRATTTETVTDRNDAWFGTGRPFNSESDDVYASNFSAPRQLLKRK